MKFASPSTSILRTFWAKHSTMVLTFAIALMAVLGVMKLGEEFWRLILDWAPGTSAAVDIKFRYKEVHLWFAGKPVYSELIVAVYPPETYVILWPLLGWLALAPARCLWAITSVATLLWLVYLVVKESNADKPLERVFVALMPLSMNATANGIGIGQLPVLLIPALLAGLLLLHRRSGWREDILVAALVLIALAKPTLTVPFFWIVLFVPGRLRPAILVILGYVALTIFAASFQEPGLLSILHDWVDSASAVPIRVKGVSAYGNLHIWLQTLGLPEWSLPASLLVLVALGFWIYLNRHLDIWLLLGVTAIVARFWTYHRWHSDLLILLPMITLFRIAKQDSSADRSAVLAGVLLAITVLAMFAPYRVLYLPSPWSLLFTGGHAIVWIVMLIFLLYQAYQKKNRTSTT